MNDFPYAGRFAVHRTLPQGGRPRDEVLEHLVLGQADVGVSEEVTVEPAQHAIVSTQQVSPGRR